MRGRKPVPTALKVVRGNPGGRPLPENEPTPSTDGIEMPPYLSEDAAAHWPIVSKQLKDAGLLTTVDTAALALYCEAFAQWHFANEQVVTNGPVITKPSGIATQSPYLQIAHMAHEQMRKLLIEFGMTPSSRTRVAKAPGNESDAYAGFVKKRATK